MIGRPFKKKLVRINFMIDDILHVFDTTSKQSFNSSIKAFKHKNRNQTEARTFNRIDEMQENNIENKDEKGNRNDESIQINEDFPIFSTEYENERNENNEDPFFLVDNIDSPPFSFQDDSDLYFFI